MHRALVSCIAGGGSIHVQLARHGVILAAFLLSRIRQPRAFRTQMNRRFGKVSPISSPAERPADARIGSARVRIADAGAFLACALDGSPVQGGAAPVRAPRTLEAICGGRV